VINVFFVEDVYLCENPSLQPVPDIVSAYADRHTTPDDALLSELAQHTLGTHPHAHMLSGHVQGQLLSQISRMVSPRRILEIGTFTGYSALCLAKGLVAEGQLHTIEIREEDAATARRFFDRSDDGHRMHIHTGDACHVIEALKEAWDLVFIDADKVNYTRYYESVLPRTRPGGWIIADNVLFHGQVLQDPVKGKHAIAIDAFNNHVRHDPRVEHVMLTVRDGLMLIRKKNEIA
jgi:caffeoyl-CoA O-methyltransferase